MVSAGYALKLAVAAGVPVRVADAVMDRRGPGPERGRAGAVPAPGGGRPPGRPGLARRFEPRNMPLPTWGQCTTGGRISPRSALSL